MSEKKNGDLESAWIAMVREFRQEVGRLPSDEQLLAYHYGELSEEETDRIRDLLGYYPEAARRLADLTALEPEPGDADFLSEDTLERDWQRLRARIRSEALTKWRIAASLLLILCAGLIVQDLLLEGQEGFLQRELRPLAQRGRGLPETVIQPGRRNLRLIPVLVNQSPFPEYRLEVSPAGSPPVLIVRGLEPGRDGSFELFVQRDVLPAGRYQLNVYGLREEEEELLETFPFRIEP